MDIEVTFIKCMIIIIISRDSFHTPITGKKTKLVEFTSDLQGCSTFLCGGPLVILQKSREPYFTQKCPIAIS